MSVPKIMYGPLKLGKYEHYKGDLVEVVGGAFHSESLEKLVVYHHITGMMQNEPHFWVRPFKMFFEKIEVDGKIVDRFKYIEENV